MVVHHGPRTSIIHDVDMDWYSCMDMCQDVLKTALVDLSTYIGTNINIKCEIPNLMDIMNVKNDANMLHMFDAHEDDKCRKIKIYVSFALNESQMAQYITFRPTQGQAILGKTSLFEDLDFSDIFDNDLLAGAVINVNHEIYAVKGKEVDDEMQLALDNVLEDFDTLAPMGVEFDFFFSLKKNFILVLPMKNGKLEAMMKLTVIVSMN